MSVLSADVIDQWMLNRKPAAKDLAAPPAGSDLKPVPGDPGLPLLGHSIEMLRLGVRYGLKRYETHGPVSWVRAFGITVVSGAGPDAAQVVLTNKDKAYSQQG